MGIKLPQDYYKDELHFFVFESLSDQFDQYPLLGRETFADDFRNVIHEQITQVIIPPA